MAIEWDSIQEIEWLLNFLLKIKILIVYKGIYNGLSENAYKEY